MFRPAAFIAAIALVACLAQMASAGFTDHHEPSGCGGDGEGSGPSSPTGQSLSLSDPVEFVNGEFVWNEIDLHVPGRGIDFVLRRSYRSKLGLTSNRPNLATWNNFNSPLGNDWDHSYNIMLVSDSAPFPPLGLANYVLFDGSGRADRFYSDDAANPCATSGDTTDPGTEPVTIGPGEVPHPWEYDPPDTLNAFYHRASLNQGNYSGNTDPISQSQLPQYIAVGQAEGVPRMFFPNGLVWEFEEDYVVTGVYRISRILDRNNNIMEFTYSPSTGRLIQVTDTMGRIYDFTYDTAGRLQSVQDFSGRTVQYRYYDDQNPDGNEGDLKRVILPAVKTSQEFPLPAEFADHVHGRVWEYTYYKPGTEPGNFAENSALKSIRDPNDNILLENSYADGEAMFPSGMFNREGPWIVSQLRGTPCPGQPAECTQQGRYDYRYTYVDNFQDKGILYVTINNRAGNAKAFRISYNRDRRVEWRRDYSGAADPNLPSDIMSSPQLNMPSLPDRTGETYWQFDYEYDSRTGLLTKSTLPNGDYTLNYYAGYPTQTCESGSYTPKINPSANNLLERRLFAFGNTNEQSPDAAWAWVYDGSSGSSGCGCAGVFAETTTDPLGRVTEYDIDPITGNLLAIRYPQVAASSSYTGSAYVAEENFEYNSFGQRTRSRGAVLQGTAAGDYRRETLYDYETLPDSTPGYLIEERIVMSTDPADDLVTTFERDILGNISRVTLPNGNARTYLYDQANRLRRERAIASDDTVLQQIDHWYDANGNLIRRDVAHLNDDGTAADGSNSAWTTLYVYDALNRLIEQYDERDPVEVALSVRGPGDLTSGDLANFVVNKWEYDLNDRRTKWIKGEATAAHDPDNIEEWEWDARDLLLRHTVGKSGSANYSATEYDYDGRKRLVETRRGLGSSTDSPVQVETRVYDVLSNLLEVEVRDADPSNTRSVKMVYEYDLIGNPLSSRMYDVDGSTETLLRETLNEFDAMDRLVLQSAWWDVPTGHPFPADLPPSENYIELRNFYSPAGLLVRSRDPRVDPANPSVPIETLYSYDRAGRLELVEDADDNQSITIYDKNSNVVESVSIEYEPEPVSGPRPSKTFIISTVYDDLDRAIQTTDGAGNTTTMAYDSRGNVVAMWDPRDNQTWFTYDGLSRQLSTNRVMKSGGTGAGTVESTIVTAQVWDESSRLIAQIDDNGNATRYAYDSQDRWIATQYADGRKEEAGDGTLSWTGGAARPSLVGFVPALDAFGRITQFTASDGQVSVLSEYDWLGREVSREAYSGTTLTDDETYVYDAAGSLLEATRDAADNFQDSRVLRAYDSLGRVITETVEYDLTTSPDQTTVHYGYDLSGNLTDIRYPSGGWVHRTVDRLNRYAAIEWSGDFSDQINHPLASVTTSTYAGAGRPHERVHANGVVTSWAYNGIDGTPNATGDHGFYQVRQLEHRLDPGGTNDTLLERRLIAWDPSQNKSGVNADRWAPTTPTPWVHTYTYDSADRLIHAVETADALQVRNIPYVLDGVHNRITVSGQPYQPFQAQQTATDAYKLNQYTAVPSIAPVVEHDDRGNLIEFSDGCPDLNGDYVIDTTDLGILTGEFGCTSGCVADLNDDGVVDSTDMGILLGAFGQSCQGQLLAYDYRNQLIQHFDYGTDDTLDIQRDAFGRAIRLRFDDGTTTREQRRVYGDHYHWTLLETHDDAALEPTIYLGSGWLDDFVALVSEDAFGDATPRTLLSDEMGTVQALVSPGGAVLERYEYGPYGEQVVIDAQADVVLPASAFGVLVGFQGHPALGVQGLVEMRFRTYSPGMGRFLTRDPLGAKAGPNVYIMAWSNPMGWVDPTGLIPVNRATPSSGSDSGTECETSLDGIEIKPIGGFPQWYGKRVSTFRIGIHRGRRNGDVDSGEIIIPWWRTGWRSFGVKIAGREQWERDAVNSLCRKRYRVTVKCKEECCDGTSTLSTKEQLIWIHGKIVRRQSIGQRGRDVIVIGIDCEIDQSLIRDRLSAMAKEICGEGGSMQDASPNPI